MGDILAGAYPWVKSLHVISVISWMAGMFYLPRLFVYHVETDPDHATAAETFEKWELLLLKRIINPAMTATWIFGLLLLLTPGVVDWGAFWIYIKLAAVVMMSGFHGWLSAERKRLVAGTATKTGRQYRILNEVPTVLMIIIVVMVIARPF